MKRLLLILAALPALAQTSVPWRASTGDITLTSSSTYTLTVQQNGSNVQNLQSAVVSCDTQTFTVAQSMNGTAATATAVSQVITGTVAVSAATLTVLPPFPLNTTLTMTAWKASNVGTGLAIAATQPFAAGLVVLNLGGRSLGSTSTGLNYSLLVTNTGGSSCNLRIDIYGSQIQ